MLPDLKFRPQAFPGRAGGEDLAALGQVGEAGGGIDRFHINVEVHPFRRADIPQEDLAKKIKTNIYFLVYWKSGLGRDIHVLCGIAYDILWIITVYEPDPAEWVNPVTRRVV